jgi:hypothetical protein
MRKDAALRGAAMLRSSTGAEPGYPEGAIGETKDDGLADVEAAP